MHLGGVTRWRGTFHDRLNPKQHTTASRGGSVPASPTGESLGQPVDTGAEALH